MDDDHFTLMRDELLRLAMSARDCLREHEEEGDHDATVRCLKDDINNCFGHGAWDTFAHETRP